MKVIEVRGAAEHNLKRIDVDIPRDALVVVTGVSGSGKSSLVFDTIGREAQRRYLETFSSYARQFLGRVGRPSVASITGLSPAITVEQRTTLRNPRSTVGTLTSLYDDLRLLFARLGQAPSGTDLQRRLFSFNSPFGACPVCHGLGVEDRLDPALLIADPRKSVRQGALVITTPTGYVIYSQVTIDVLDQVCRAHGFDVDTPWKDLTDEQRRVVLYGSDRLRIPYGKHPLSSRLRWSGITAKPREEGVYKGILPVMEQILARSRNRNILRFVRSLPCRACGGTRLRPEALAVRFRGRHIGEYASLEIGQVRAEFEAIRFDATEAPVGTPIREAMLRRAVLLGRLGLGHLALDRVSTSLSGGEAQRVRLASQVGSELRGVLYVLDEPSVGLHASEQERLLDVLRELRDRGNTVLVVEHDEQTMREADWLVDIGPGSGEQGGELLFSGTVEEFLEGKAGALPHTCHAEPGHEPQAPAASESQTAVHQPEPSAAGESQTAAHQPQASAARESEAAAREPHIAAHQKTGVAQGSSLAHSRTRAFLTGAERVAWPHEPRDGSGVLRLAGVRRHNLQDVDVEFLLGALNVVTGVSGAGKSSLVEELVERVQSAPRDGVEKVIHVDQSPIGRTPRSNPATYTGLSETVRDLFAAQPEAVARGFGKARFSFNLPGGRCDVCQGAGVEQVGMHFLGNVDVVCEACGGRRFNDETLEIRYRGLNIHDVLETTIARASDLLSDTPRAKRILSVLHALGLGYLRLGQPSTTLSGGEAQRVKLAAELSRPGRGRTLYVLDEPTTGLHAADVRVLLSALTRLVEQGHTVVTIEHHLDLIRAADRVIDLGPGSGRHGGRVVAVGTPAEIAECGESLTGASLRGKAGALPHTFKGDPRSVAQGESRPAGGGGTGVAQGDRWAAGGGGTGVAQGSSLARTPDIRFTNVATHNLHIPEVVFPAGRFTVVTGVSGSGKSSLAFETLYAEARNRFTDSFSTYSRRFLEKLGDAEFDAVSGLTPAVAVRQRVPSRNPRSTVGTMTDIADYYRLLFSRAGEFPCPSCRATTGTDGSACPSCGWQPSLPMTSTMFSPNAEQGACPSCKGLGEALECDPDRLVTHPGRPLLDGAMDGHRTGRFYGERQGQHMAILRAVGRALDIDFGAAWESLDARARDVAMHGAGDREFDVEWHYRRGTREGTHRFRSKWIGLAGYVGQEYERKHADHRGEALEPLMRRVRCPACRGTRLKPERLEVRVGACNIAELLALTVEESLAFFNDWSVSPRAAALGAGVRHDVITRLEKLRDGGLDYLSLDRPAATLSAGEAQRVRLATEVSEGLTGITYVLDEPTAGLHPRDTERLLRLIAGLRQAGNTVIVVEHDPDVIRAADHVIELGPGAGAFGGRLVASGTPRALVAHEPARPARRLRTLRPGVTVQGATCHNIRDLSVDFPAGGLVAVTGVSGSGKSTLVFDVLAPALEARLAERARLAPCPTPDLPGPDRCPTQANKLVAQRPALALTLHEPFERLAVATRDSLPASPSSTPLSVVGAWDGIRAAFAATDQARAHGFTARYFSLHLKGGRCEACEGAGRLRVSMDFLPDAWVQCEACKGRRYGAEALECLIDGRSIADVLAMSVGDVRASLEANAAVAPALALLEEIGLGYLRAGQGADTLSGGERQRLALAADLRTRSTARSIYLFDEPTTGLHADDVTRLLALFDRLIAEGHTLVVVEHNLQVIAAADHVIDLGPDGGSRGGRVVAQGTPDQIAAAQSWTGRALSRMT